MTAVYAMDRGVTCILRFSTCETVVDEEEVFARLDGRGFSSSDSSSSCSLLVVASPVAPGPSGSPVAPGSSGLPLAMSLGSDGKGSSSGLIPVNTDLGEVKMDRKTCQMSVSGEIV